MSSEYTTLVQGLETYRLADLRPYHANPPYGMGKQAEGVLGDNVYGAELDAFQHTGGTPQRNGVPHSLEP